MNSQEILRQFSGRNRQTEAPPPNFMEQMQQTIQQETPNISYTENGARGYRTTGKNLLDLNFKVSSLRSWTEKDIYEEFMKAFYDDPLTAWKWLFYLRDIRGGLGERRSFRAIIKGIAHTRPQEMKLLIPYIAEYGRFDDLWCLLDTSLRGDIIAYVNQQLLADIEAYQNNKSVSLLAKWLPSRNASSRNTKNYADIIMSGLGLTQPEYQSILSRLREYLDIVERKMTSDRWREIDYNGVPSKANLIYNSAFLKHDEERRREYLDALSKGDTSVKINAGTLFPYEILHRYGRSYSRHYDETLEQLWKNLPDYVAGAQNVMVVADGSGSMTRKVGGSTAVSCLAVANSLAIYFAERNSGVYKDQYITFSEHPQLVSFKNAKSLLEKIQIAERYNEVASTNIEAVFDLVLKTAVQNHLSQEELPQTILILSDMEFDMCACGNSYRRANQALFETIANRYKKAGYKLPKLAFWNICGRTNTIPVTQNKMGVILVSGFSPSICKMVLSNKIDPYEALLDELNTERYQPIEDALKGGEA